MKQSSSVAVVVLVAILSVAAADVSHIGKVIQLPWCVVIAGGKHPFD